MKKKFIHWKENQELFIKNFNLFFRSKKWVGSKKIFGSQSFSQGSSQSSSQEPKVYYTCNISTKKKNETDNNEKKVKM